MDFPIKNGDFPLLCKRSPEGKLVPITPITMVYGTYNELVTGANLNQLTSLGGPTLYRRVPPLVMSLQERAPPGDEFTEPMN